MPNLRRDACVTQLEEAIRRALEREVTVRIITDYSMLNRHLRRNEATGEFPERTGVARLLLEQREGLQVRVPRGTMHTKVRV